MIRNSFILLALATLASPVAAFGQAGVNARATVGVCTYAECALGISPVWNGLALVRGTDRENVDVLGFFLPHDVSAAFAGSDSATVLAKRALSVRRKGALLTDFGGLLLAGAAVIAIRDRHLSTQSNTLGIAGAGLLTLSIPAQFIADGHLSQAVWWYNIQFASKQ